MTHAAPTPRVTDRVPASALAIGAIITVQLGAALAIGLFDRVGPGGAAWLRLVFGAVIFLALVRPKLSDYTLRELRVPLLLGVITAIMTVCFMSAIARIPLGTAVAIEFLGPLSVGVLQSHSRRNLAWPLLGFVGVLALTQPWTGAIDPIGVLFGLGSAAGWGTYILLTQHVGDRFEGFTGLAFSIPVAAVVTSVVGIPSVWGHLTPSVVLASVGIAVLMPVIPFSLEMLALRRMTTASFGTLMALEPMLGTVWGVILLAQIPDALQVVGVALVVAAGIGAARTGHRNAAEHAHFTTPGTA